METKQIINGLLDKADRVADQSAGRIMKQAAKRLEELDQDQKWIPVTERLPENMDDRVLVLLPTISYNYPIGNQRIDTDRYRGEYRKWVRYGDKVTHWMPLPEPPSGERRTDA